ncbi:hypothetical protein GE061_010048 [Apolygus lucorum]|uniref:MARVEL domain-containing protein n=1 Tax=Apolygus lucorum TaxID=248454 RepID=A0A6A4KAI3_APOLU|nr:hypothetical protein GE061_010048 [Apolygus lucorum]
MSLAELIVKICSLVVGGVCYVLLIFFHSALYTTYEKLIICTIFSGFFILYIAFSINVFLGKETDIELNSAWALYGVAAYVGAGTLCIVTFWDQSSIEAWLGLITGIVSFLMASILVADVIILQSG